MYLGDVAVCFDFWFFSRYSTKLSNSSYHPNDFVRGTEPGRALVPVNAICSTTQTQWPFAVLAAGNALPPAPGIRSLDRSQLNWHNPQNCASQTSGRETKPEKSQLRWFPPASALSIPIPNFPAPWYGFCMEITRLLPFPFSSHTKPAHFFTVPPQLCLASCHKNLPPDLRQIAEDSRDKGNIKLEVGQWGKTYLFHWLDEHSFI